MQRRRFQPGLVTAGISCFFLAVFRLVEMPRPFILPLAVFFGALTWFAFDAGGLPPCERKLQAFTRSAVIFFAAALCDLALTALGPRGFADAPSLAFALLPIGQGIAALWERSRLSRRLRSAWSAAR
jgi:hypothetical protein